MRVGLDRAYPIENSVDSAVVFLLRELRHLFGPLLPNAWTYHRVSIPLRNMTEINGILQSINDKFYSDWLNYQKSLFSVTLYSAISTSSFLFVRPPKLHWRTSRLIAWSMNSKIKIDTKYLG